MAVSMYCSWMPCHRASIPARKQPAAKPCFHTIDHLCGCEHWKVPQNPSSSRCSSILDSLLYIQSIMTNMSHTSQKHPPHLLLYTMCMCGTSINMYVHMSACNMRVEQYSVFQYFAYIEVNKYIHTYVHQLCSGASAGR